MVHVQHEFLRLRLGVPENSHEDMSDVAHEIDRVVPHYRHPRPVGAGELIGFLLAQLLALGVSVSGIRLWWHACRLDC